MLLEAASAPEDLAMLAEVPLERLQNMAEGALCSDETAYHLEQQLTLPSGWLDRMNSAVPETYLNLLANPHGRLADDDSAHSGSSSAAPAAPPPSVVADPLKTLDSTASAPSSEGKVAETSPVIASTSAELPSAAVSQGSADALPETLGSSSTTVAPALEDAPAQQSLLGEDTSSSQQSSVNAPQLAAPVPPLLKDENAMTTPTELRRANLNVLLSGKGAKSALARLLSLSPASVTGMLNGAKPLDKDLLHTVTQALGLPDGWFDKERAEKDIPAATLKHLSPLARGAAAPPAAPRTRASKTASSADTASQGTNAAPAASPAPAAGASLPASAPADEKPKTWPSSTGSKVGRLRDLTGTPGATPAAAAAPSSAASAPAAPAPQSPAASASSPAPANGVTAAPAASRATPDHQRGDTHNGATAILSESLLPPIAEALIRTLAQKASSGALSEDKAFELLGNVRTL